MKREILREDEVIEALQTMNGWGVDGNELRKKWKFDNFAQALAFVNAIGGLAEAADHHPDITFGWGYVNINLTTHDRGGITDVDLSLARSIDNI